MGFNPPPGPFNPQQNPQGSQGPFGPQGPFSPGPPGPGGPGMPPFPQGPGAHQPPASPPPSFIPQQQVSAYAVDPGSIAGCLFRFTYIWQTNRDQYWFYPIFVGRTSVSGYRFFGGRWNYYGVDLRKISSFTCY
ncbi:collagen-like protein [Paenibacillus sp. YPG26]|nr:collagen-like protein [Paenibacillus sp. YPG26]USB33071.1 collagen-like protein [Paenibacillus sp. YPG26]